MQRVKVKKAQPGYTEGAAGRPQSVSSDEETVFRGRAAATEASFEACGAVPERFGRGGREGPAVK